MWSKLAHKAAKHTGPTPTFALHLLCLPKFHKNDGANLRLPFLHPPFRFVRGAPTTAVRLTPAVPKTALPGTPPAIVQTPGHGRTGTTCAGRTCHSSHSTWWSNDISTTGPPPGPAKLPTTTPLGTAPPKLFAESFPPTLASFLAPFLLPFTALVMRVFLVPFCLPC